MQQQNVEGQKTPEQAQALRPQNGAPAVRAQRGAAPPRSAAADRLLNSGSGDSTLGAALGNAASYTAKALASGATRLAGVALSASAKGLHKLGAKAHKAKEDHKTADARSNSHVAHKQLLGAQEKLQIARQRQQQAAGGGDLVAQAKAQVKMDRAQDKLARAQANISQHTLPVAAEPPKLTRKHKSAYAAKAAASGAANGLASALGAAARGMESLHAKAYRSKDKQLAKMENQSYSIAKASHHASNRKMNRLLDKQARMDTTDPKLEARIERAEAKATRAGNAIRGHWESTQAQLLEAAQQRMPHPAEQQALPQQPQQPAVPQQVQQQQVPQQVPQQVQQQVPQQVQQQVPQQPQQQVPQQVPNGPSMPGSWTN